MPKGKSIPPRFAVRVITMNVKGMPRSRPMDFKSKTAKGRTLTKVMSLERIMEQHKVTKTNTITSVLRLFTRSTIE